MERKIAARYILTGTGEPIYNGIVTFDERGTVTNISDCTFNPQTLEDVDYYDGVIVPGFVNTHCHLELSYMKGVLPEHTGLAGFVKRIMETKFSFPEEVQRAAIAAADEAMWKSGVQAVGDISNTPVSFDTKKNSPVKYVTFLEIFDVLFGGNHTEIMEQGAGLARTARAMGLETYVTLHATYSVSDKLFRAYAGMENTEAMSIHYRESIDDDLLFHKEGKFWELFQDKGFYIDFLSDGSSTNRIVNHIPGDRRILLVHNSNVNGEDIRRMKEHFANVSWALCPQSNLYIEQKLPPVGLLKESGLNLTIGTDSLSSNTALSMVAEMRTLSDNFNLPIQEVVRWATLNGAKALGLDQEMGSFEPGKRPGAVLIEGLDENLRFTDDTTSRRIL